MMTVGLGDFAALYFKNSVFIFICLRNEHAADQRKDRMSMRRQTYITKQKGLFEQLLAFSHMSLSTKNFLTENNDFVG